MYVYTEADGRVTCVVENEEYADESYFQFDFPVDFEIDKIFDYRIVDGELVYDPIQTIDVERIDELKQKLAETDYVVAKIAESQITGIALNSDDAERYADIITQRQQWRDQINELEESVQNGSEE